MRQGKKFRILTSLIAILILTGLVIPSSLAQDTEPNDSFATAEEIEADTYAAFLDPNDTDFFEFDPEEGMSFEVTVHPYYELALTVTIYDSNQDEVIQQSSVNPGEFVELRVEDPEEGPYYIEVVSPNSENTGGYSLDIEEELRLSVLTISVVDEDGDPISGAEVQSVEEPPEQEGELFQLTDAQGEVTFTELERGSYTFQYR